MQTITTEKVQKLVELDEIFSGKLRAESDVYSNALNLSKDLSGVIEIDGQTAEINESVMWDHIRYNLDDAEHPTYKYLANKYPEVFAAQAETEKARIELAAFTKNELGFEYDRMKPSTLVQLTIQAAEYVLRKHGLIQAVDGE